MVVNIPIVTLDKIYIKPDDENIIFFDCTRINGSNRIVSRTKESIDFQLNNIINNFCEKKILLADDVVYSGNVLKYIIDKLNMGGVEVIGIITSICSTSSYNYFNKKLKYGIKTNYLMDEDVIDQVCERDFYFGIAGGGIMVENNNNILKAPYFKPFGNPNERASIPVEYEDYFSYDCLKRSLILWKEIESLKGSSVLARELPEEIVGVDKNTDVVKMLKKEMIKYEKNSNWNNG